MTILITRILPKWPWSSTASDRRANEGETLAQAQRYPAMTQPDIWYVAFGPSKDDEDGARGVARTTRKFKSEVDAKLFAMQILAKGWTASAGTINPHQPKRVIGAADIERWADPALGG